MRNAAVTAHFDGVSTLAIRQQQPLHLQCQQSPKKKILFVTSEFADLVKVGGLGDVSAALPRALMPAMTFVC